jgi:hypothetical protein
MKINVNEAFKNLAGADLTVPSEDGTLKTLNIKDVCVTALLTETPGVTLTPEHKVKRFSLSEAIYKAEKEVELKVEDVVLLKELVGNNYGPLIVGQFYRSLGE